MRNSAPEGRSDHCGGRQDREEITVVGRSGVRIGRTRWRLCVDDHESHAGARQSPWACVRARGRPVRCRVRAWRAVVGALLFERRSRRRFPLLRRDWGDLALLGGPAGTRGDGSTLAREPELPRPGKRASAHLVPGTRRHVRDDRLRRRTARLEERRSPGSRLELRPVAEDRAVGREALGRRRLRVGEHES